MSTEHLTAHSSVGATLISRPNASDEMKAVGVYHIKCLDKDGGLRWETEAPNLCTYQGRNFMLDETFAGSSYTASWYMSLITAGTATTTSTYASPTVTEVTSSIIANRLAVTWNTSSNAAKTSSTISFSILAAATIVGNMMVTGGSGVATVGNTSASNGILFSAGNFTSGSKSCSAGDVLQVTYTIQV